MRRIWLVVPATMAMVCGSAPIVGAATAGPALYEVHAPRIPGPSLGQPGQAPVRNWTSTNWSGYALAGSAISDATGSWTVPQVGQPKNIRQVQFSSTWVGIDGYNNSNLIQAGTEQDWINGKPFYQAWWEILPAPETPIPSLAIHPGDSMSVSLSQGLPNWTITVTDHTTGQTYSIQQPYSGPLTSAEWIQEAPTVGSHVAKLAADSTVVFDSGTVNGASPGLKNAEQGAMFRGRKQISTPSLPDSDVSPDGFAVAFGNLAPLSPGS